MKTPITRMHLKVVPGLTLAALLATTTLHSQTPVPAPATVAVEQADMLSADDLEDLLAPIALYPDALVALILPAAAVPSDITLAARYLNQYGDDADVSDQPWDPSVRSLANYPEVLKWMDENLEWTTSLGEAFVVQPADVMNAVQELRLAAKDNGNLRNTPQQTVIVEEAPAAETTTVVREVVRIVPSDPEVIYVPVYDPEVVYVETYRPDYTPLITFGVGLAVGSWLNYDCDWRGRNVYYGDGCGWNNRGRWYDRGRYDGGRNVNVVTNNNTVNNFTNIVNNREGNRWQANERSRRFYNQRRNQNLGNARVARANAAVRTPQANNRPKNKADRAKLAANRPARVNKPNRAKAITKNTAAKRANAKVAATRPNAAKAKNNGANNGSKANVKKPANRPASAAPKVANQNGNKKKAQNARPKTAAAATKPANPQKKKPSAAPAVQGGGGAAQAKKGNNGGQNRNQAKPGKQNANANANRPSSAPKVSQQKAKKPQAQASKPKPQASKPKPQAQAQKIQQPKKQQQQQVQRQQQRPKPQQAKPQQQRPKSQPQQQAKRQSAPKQQAAKKQGGGGGGGNKQSSGGDKKKKKD